MALLIVNAFSDDTIEPPLNRLPNSVVLSVTDNHGTPVAGLAVANFKVQPVVVTPSLSMVNVVGVIAGVFPGFYVVDVATIGKNRWKEGVYIFAIAIERGPDHGQCLASVLVA
jgi:hypothetical protein